MSKGLTVYQRIRDAAAQGKGLRLSAEDAGALYFGDEAIREAAAQDDDAARERLLAAREQAQSAPAAPAPAPEQPEAPQAPAQSSGFGRR